MRPTRRANRRSILRIPNQLIGNSVYFEFQWTSPGHQDLVVIQRTHFKIQFKKRNSIVSSTSLKRSNGLNIGELPAYEWYLIQQDSNDEHKEKHKKANGFCHDDTEKEEDSIDLRMIAF